jgi:hypothetical protein
MGSRRHLLTNIFTRKNRAFYNFGRLFKLDKIPEEDLITYLKSGFENSGTVFEPELIRQLLLRAGHIPFYVQMLASILWDITVLKFDRVTAQLLDEAVNTALWHQADYYLALIQELTAYQQKVLQAIAMENKGVFTREYGRRHYLSASSSTQRAVDKLMEKDILNKTENEYQFSDPLFHLWLVKGAV